MTGVDPAAFRRSAGRFASGIVVVSTSLDDALTAMECRTTAVHDGGDHSIVVGEVLAVTAPRADVAPLLYHAGRYRRLGG
jgi:flavin reductase (DIM6/NTAB) family NADH-FMN oxidoreductase RutF